MKKNIQVYIFIISILGISNSGNGQFSISYQHSGFSRVGIGYNFSQKIWTELRIYDHSYYGNITTELALLYNVSIKESHVIYLGFGGLAGDSFGLAIPIGLQFRPLENFRRLSLQIELEPVFVFRGGVALLSSGGIRYTFGKKQATSTSK